MLTGIIAFLPILIHLIIGQYPNLAQLPLEYLGWFFFFAFFVFIIDLLIDLRSFCYCSCLKDCHETPHTDHVMDIRNGTVGAEVPSVPPNLRVSGLSTTPTRIDRELARDGGHLEWGSGAQLPNPENDLGRNNTHGGDDDPPPYAAVTNQETHGGNDNPPPYTAVMNTEMA